MGFSLPSIKCSWLLLASDYYRALFRYLNCAQRFDYRRLDSSRKLEGVAEHLIDDSEKRICRLSVEFQSPYVIERRSKPHSDLFKWIVSSVTNERTRFAIELTLVDLC